MVWVHIVLREMFGSLLLLLEKETPGDKAQQCFGIDVSEDSLEQPSSFPP